jgi:ribonucleotide reductase beta subunit family protein with ferritin-like domain
MYKNMNLIPEPICDPMNDRFFLGEINPKYAKIWELYETQLSLMWSHNKIDMSQDYDHFMQLTPDEQKFIKMTLAFFASADGIVNFNLQTQFLNEIHVPEIKVAYTFQCMMENIHNKVYSNMIINLIRNKGEQEKLLNAIGTLPVIKKMSDWAFKWITGDIPLGKRIIAFVIIEGVFFSSSFAAIFWLKKTKGVDTLFMRGLVESNEYIARDEGMHTDFACELYTHIVNKVSFEDVKEMFLEANNICADFVNNSIQTKLIGMNAELMKQYVQFVSDRLLVSLGYEKIYNTTNPFDFMNTITLRLKTNFFENRPTEYQSAHTQKNQDKKEFKILDDF